MSSGTSEVVLVRHGETEWSRDGRHTGRTDVPLTEPGREEAALLGARLAPWRFARVLASPLRRALDTCRLAGYGDLVEVREDLAEWDYGAYEGRTTVDIRAERLAPWRFAGVLASPLRRALDTCGLAGYGDLVEVREDLAEWDYGAYEGRTTVDIRAERPGWTLWIDGVPAGETTEQVGERADRIVSELRTAGGDVAVFAHGHVLRVLAARWVGLPPVEGRALALSTAAICVLGFERETPVIVRWNEETHGGAPERARGAG